VQRLAQHGLTLVEERRLSRILEDLGRLDEEHFVAAEERRAPLKKGFAQGIDLFCFSISAKKKKKALFFGYRAARGDLLLHEDEDESLGQLKAIESGHELLESENLEDGIRRGG